jgi:hypothetical protein
MVLYVCWHQHRRIHSPSALLGTSWPFVTDCQHCSTGLAGGWAVQLPWNPFLLALTSGVPLLEFPKPQDFSCFWNVREGERGCENEGGHRQNLDSCAPPFLSLNLYLFWLPWRGGLRAVTTTSTAAELLTPWLPWELWAAGSALHSALQGFGLIHGPFWNCGRSQLRDAVVLFPGGCTSAQSTSLLF